MDRIKLRIIGHTAGRKSRMNTQQYQKLLLIIVAIGLIPIALAYGMAPEKILTPIFGFPVESINLVHMFRAVMGLYIGQLIFWLLGAFNPRLRRPALYSLVIFMLGIAAGRIFSLLIDGISHWILMVYLFLELAIGFAGIVLLKKEVSI